MKKYRDAYFLKAKQENYPARSVYKLKELDVKFKILQPGMKVLDLGASPGSWSLEAASRVGVKGLVLACDLKPAETSFPPNVYFRLENALEPTPEFMAELENMGPFDCVLSDMAPRTTGAKFTDQARSLELCLQALEMARLCLRPGGSFVTKIFMGPDMDELISAMRGAFHKVKPFKPKSSRAESKEIFYVGLDFKLEHFANEMNKMEDQDGRT